MSLYGPGLVAATAGQAYDLNDGRAIRLLSYDLGLASIRRLAQRSPLQQGDTDLGYRIDPRFIDLFWALEAADAEAGLLSLREQFLQVWVAREVPVQLTFSFPDRQRALDVHLEGELSWERVGRVEKVSGVFKASDPRLYDPDIHTIPFSLTDSGGSGSGWPIPWPIPWPIGDDVLNLAVSLQYAGNSYLAAPEYPRIRIFGPIDSPIISNETTGEVIDLSAGGGLSLADPTEWVEIDLAGPDRRDSKTLRDQSGASVDQYLTPESDLVTWHLAPAGEQLYDGSWAAGQNVVRVAGTNVTSQTLVTMNYYDRYWAV